tara:strand:- start:219 stop:455 length:237 start_codon:yes stop_codon:yes gene_type:complete
MNYLQLLLIEASIVGIVVMFLGTLLTFISVYSKGKSTKFIWNFGMFFILFLTGALAHILFEYIGFNKYYCKMFNKTRK